MNLIKSNLLAVLLLAVTSMPATVLADTSILSATVAATSADESTMAAVNLPTGARELMQKIHTRKIEMMQSTDPAKCESLINAQKEDRANLKKMGVSEGGMDIMPADGDMLYSGDPSERGDCGMAWGRNGSRCNTVDDQRIDAMEKRLDMMQMMLQMMLKR